MGPTWGPPGSCRPHLGPMLVPWTLLSGISSLPDSVMHRALYFVDAHFFNTLRPRQVDHQFANDIFRCIFNENVWILIDIAWYSIIGSDNGLALIVLQAIIWINVDYRRVYTSLGLNDSTRGGQDEITILESTFSNQCSCIEETVVFWSLIRLLSIMIGISSKVLKRQNYNIDLDNGLAPNSLAIWSKYGRPWLRIHIAEMNNTFINCN